MPRKALPYFDSHSDPLPQRIATGLHKIGLAMKQQDWQQANQQGLSATQGQILAAIAGGPPLSGKELSERLGIKLPTISESVAALVDKGLVKRAPDPRHPRARLIVPTARGRALGKQARSWPEFLSEAVDGLTPTEQRAFFTGVVKMIRSLQEQSLVPVSGMCVTCVHFRPHVHSGTRPHHCAFVDAPLADDQLRLDCPEHERADAPTRQQAWAQFTGLDQAGDS